MKICKCGGKKHFNSKMCRSCRNKELRSNPKSNPNYRHGETVGKQSKEYMIWSQMIQRCSNKKNKHYKNYGARGITFCFSWNDFDVFLSDMGKCPEGMTLERINNERGYSKDNCKWATRTEQSLNRRLFKNKTSKYKGVYWAKKRKKWAVSITRNKSRYWGGYHKTQKEALIAYNKLLKDIQP